jgi:enoyl-CoA hydratase/carnithine racemase
MSARVELEMSDGVGVVTIDNPPVNALTNEVLDRLAETAEVLATEHGIRAVVVAGSGTKAFAAGADLREFERALSNREWIEDHVSRSRRAFTLLEQLPQPMIAAVQASAVGGGLELALVCDFIVADPGALFGLPEVRLGLMPGGGGTQRLPRRIGIGRAKELLLLGRTIDAEAALRIGLANLISSPESSVQEARELAAQIAMLPALSMQSTKRAVNASTLNGDLAIGLDRERELFMDIFMSHDAGEGIRAFAQDRAPVFAHR